MLNLLELPGELLERILMLVPCASLLEATRTCKAFHRAISGAHLRQSLLRAHDARLGPFLTAGDRRLREVQAKSEGVLKVLA